MSGKTFGKWPEMAEKTSGKMSKTFFDKNKSMIKSEKCSEKMSGKMSENISGKNV